MAPIIAGTRSRRRDRPQPEIGIYATETGHENLSEPAYRRLTRLSRQADASQGLEISRRFPGFMS
jgi:hypothetical protein